MAEFESSGTRNLESDEGASGKAEDSPDIMEVPRESETEEQASATREDQLTPTRERVQGEKHGNPSNRDNAENQSPSGQNQGDPRVGGSNERIKHPDLSKEPNLESVAEKYRTKFYDVYRKEAEEYDKGFIKKYDEDLNTTLIFAGLFSAVASAFIIQVQSDFKPDPNEETAALLRIIIYKMDNTTLGDDIPTVPQWTGPPHTSVVVQAMLFASLAASLFSAFLAMLGKQWVNRYESIDVRGSAIERYHNRQHKLDGTVTWYFNPVMELLPLMLQGALFLLGCALSRYLWEINTSIALVILCATSFGLVFYLFIVVAGAAYTSCPYQTPAAQLLRHALDALARIPDTFHNISSSLRRIPSSLRRTAVSLHLTLSTAIGASIVRNILVELWNKRNGRLRSLHSFAYPFLLALLLPIGLLLDTCHLLVSMIRKVCRLVRQPEWHTTVLDQRCVLWTLRTSLDRPVRLSALDYLSAMELPHLDPTLATHCLETLGRDSGHGGEFEKYALCYFSMVSNLAVGGQSLEILEDLSERYAIAVSTNPDPYLHSGIPIVRVINRVLRAVNPGVRECTWRHPWDDYKLSSDEHVVVARALVRISRLQFQRAQPRKVPRHLLRFALHSLSLDPPPPTSVIVDSLSIIATDLDLGVYPDFDESTELDWRSLITEELNTMIEAGNSDLILSKRKAISALLPYAVTMEQRGQPALLDMFFRAVQSTKSEDFIWVRPLVNTLFSTLSPRFSDRVILLVTPYAWLYQGPRSEDEVARWALTVSAVPYTEEVGELVVKALLLAAADDTLRRCIPANLWAWLKKLQSPLYVSPQRNITQFGVVHHIRGLGDIEILKSYLLIIWQNRISLSHSGFAEMKASIMEDFAGVGMSRHRRDLIKKLEEVRQYWNESYRPRYKELKELLLQVDMEAEKTLTSSHSTFMCALPLPCP